jgi:peroxisomal 2,4-dienoyl-CoA reductase
MRPVHESTDDAPDRPLFREDLLSGRVALVTGGGTGIGFGIAHCLARYGADVALASRSPEHLDPAATRLRRLTGRRILAVPANVREPDSIRSAADRAASELGGLHILVNNAAGNFYCPSEELSPSGWRAVVETDLYGTFYASQAVFPHMREAGLGRIVSISMTLHHRGWPGMAHATAAKAGVDALTRTLALEWAPHSITVNAVAPGPIPTEGVRKAFTTGGDAEEQAGGDPFAEARHDGGFASEAIPAGRFGAPADIGHMVTYLVSPAGDWITGSIFVVDGGERLRRGAPPTTPLSTRS